MLPRLSDFLRLQEESCRGSQGDAEEVCGWSTGLQLSQQQVFISRFISAGRRCVVGDGRHFAGMMSLSILKACILPSFVLDVLVVMAYTSLGTSLLEQPLELMLGVAAWTWLHSNPRLAQYQETSDKCTFLNKLRKDAAAQCAPQSLCSPKLDHGKVIHQVPCS